MITESHESPAVSIILPTYNGSRYLAGAIESCLDQTFRDFELILVDDCSTDASPRIIAEFAEKDPRVRAVSHEQNKRLPGAINTGMSLARGRYLTWTSDDNLYRSNAIEVMAAALDREPDVAMVYAQATFIDAEDRRQGPMAIRPPDQLAHTCVVGACFLYRREVYDTIGGYDEEMFLVEDWDYWMRVSERFRLRVLDDDLYLYRNHGDSLTSQRQDRIWQKGRQLLERRLPDMKWASPAARSRGYLVAARVAWRFGDRRDALRLAGRAIGEHPGYAITRIIRRPIRRMLGKNKGFP
jgi:glycosyltransferase involved in cell wall biosynthesis